MRPFRTYFKDSTIDIYTSYWQQFFCFCLRILGEESMYGVELKPRQRTLLAKLQEMVELEDPTNEQLDKKVQELSVEMIMHSDYCRQKSVLRYFCGILGYNLSMKQWRRPCHQACERTERTEIEYCSDSSRGARGCSVSISVRPSRVGLCSVSSRPIPNRADLILGSVCSARGLPCISINLNL